MTTTPDDPRDVEIARKTVQVGVLEARVWELREQLARAQRHRGAAVGLLRGAVKDGALSGEYADLAQKVLLAADEPCPFGRRSHLHDDGLAFPLCYGYSALVAHDLATRFRQAREVQRLTRPELADRSGVSTRSIEAYERGEAVPSVLAARALASALGLTLDALVPDGEA